MTQEIYPVAAAQERLQSVQEQLERKTISFLISEISRGVTELGESLETSLELIANFLSLPLCAIFLKNQKNNEYNFFAQASLSLMSEEDSQDLAAFFTDLEKKPTLDITWPGRNIYYFRTKDSTKYTKINQPIQVLCLLYQGECLGVIVFYTENGKELPVDDQDLFQTIRDILSQRLVLEQTLQNLNELTTYNERLVESLPSGLISLDEKGHIFKVNPMALNIFELSWEEVQSKSYRSIPVFAQMAKTIEQGLQKATDSLRNEITIELPSGKEKIIGFSTRVLSNEKGHTEGLLIICRDITEIYKMEKESALRERLASLGEISAKIAHEIRNPLNPIKGFAQLIANEAEDNPEIKQYANIIVEEVDRLHRITSEFLVLARENILDIKPTEIHKLIEGVIKLLEEKCQRQGIKIKKLFSNALKELAVDRNKFEQALLNITQNAIEAMPEGGELTIRTSLLPLNAVQKYLPTKDNSLLYQQFVLIEICDTGLGIDPKIINKLFDPFFTTKESGTGLGLSITHRIISDHEGVLRLESYLKQGTRCLILLPVREK